MTSKFLWLFATFTNIATVMSRCKDSVRMLAEPLAEASPTQRDNAQLAAKSGISCLGLLRSVVGSGHAQAGHRCRLRPSDAQLSDTSPQAGSSQSQKVEPLQAPLF